MKKRVVSWLLVVLMLTSMLPTGVWAEDVYRSSEDTGRYGVSTLASAADAELEGFFGEWEGIATVANAAKLGFVKDGDKLKSGNTARDDTYTRSTLTVTMLQAAELSFDYQLDGATQNGMEVKNGSKTLYTNSSYGGGGAEIVKGKDSGTATVQANADDVITISYYRGYASRGSNCMWLSNFKASLPAQVIFHANDGTETTVQQGVFGSGTLQANTFKRDGYRFEGWATTPDGAVAYADKDSIAITENTDLYAVWTRVYRVAFQLTPADAQFSLYGDEARTALIAADSGTAYTLAAGTYYYSVSAFGYAAVQGSVTVSGDAQEPVVLAEKPVVTVTFAYADGKTDVDGGKLTVRTGERDMAAEEGSDGMAFRLPAGYAYDWSFRSANYGKQSGTVDLTGVSESGTRSVTIPMTAKSAWEGAGDISEPAAVDGVYQITSGSELAWLAQQVNAGVSDGTSFSAVLCNDIDLGDEAWTPIGNGTGKAYKGTFDGQGYTIRNLYVTGSTPMDYGLFGTVYGGTVRNVTVEGRVEVTSNSSRYGIAAIVGQLYGTTGGVENCLNRAPVKGGQYVGGIVGYVAGGSSSAEKFIKNCGNVGDVTSEGHRAAGIAANISGQVAVENCYSTGTITGGGWYSGGISAYVDSSYASVKNCYAAGSVTGSGAGAVFGKVSYSSTVVANCYYPDTLSVGDSKAVKVTEQQLKTLDSAAALGEAFMQDAKSVNGGYPILTWQITTYEVTFTVTPEDAEVRIDGAKGKQNGNVWTFRLPEGTYSYTASAFGYADESSAIEVSGAARKDITLTPVEKRTVRFSVTPEDAGAAVTVQWNGKTVAAEQDGSYRLPDGTYTYTVRAKGYAKVSQTLEVSGDVTVPVVLEPSAAWDGQTVTAPEVGDGTEASPYEIENGEQLAWLAQTVNAGNGGTRLYAVLTEDIDLGDGAWTPIGADFHEFTGRFDGQGHTVSRMKAETRYAGLFGVVKDAEIRGVVVQGIAASTDSSSGDAAGLVARTKGSTVTITECGSEVAVSGGNNGGGILGKNASSSTVVTISACYNTGDISGKARAGGISGGNTHEVNISDCYNTGSITGGSYAGGGIRGYYGGFEGTVANCYNSGAVTGTNTGAIAPGANSRISNCFYLDSGTDGNSGAAAQTAQQLQELAISDAFEHVAGRNGGMPVLKWQKLTPVVKEPVLAQNVEFGLEQVHLTSSSAVEVEDGVGMLASSRLTWDAVDGAEGYVITLWRQTAELVEGEDYTQMVLARATAFTANGTETDYDCAAELAEQGEGVYYATVTAVVDGAYTEPSLEYVDEHVAGYQMPYDRMSTVTNVKWEGTVLHWDKKPYFTAEQIYTILLSIVEDDGSYRTLTPVEVSGNAGMADLGNTFAAGRRYAAQVIAHSDADILETMGLTDSRPSQAVIYDGSGTPEIPDDHDDTWVAITSAQQWIDLANVEDMPSDPADSRSDSQQKVEWSKKYYLANDLDFSQLSAAYQTKTKSIGNTTNRFNGVLDGNGYVIRGLTLSNYDSGLFWYVGASGYIYDLKVENANVLFSDNAAVLVHNNYGLMEQCAVVNTNITADTGAVLGGMVSRNYGTIRDSYVEGGTLTSNSTTSTGHAGFVGANEEGGLIERCWTSMSVSTQSDYAGGFVGLGYGGTIRNCFALGNVSGRGYSGGFVGRSVFQGNAYESCYAAGIVTVTGAEGNGFIGGNKPDSGFQYDQSEGVWNCYYNSENTGAHGYGAEPRTGMQMRLADFVRELGSGIWTRDDAVNGGLPYLTTVKAPETAKTADITVHVAVVTYDKETYTFDFDHKSVVDVTVESTGNTRVVDVMDAAQAQGKLTYSYSTTATFGRFIHTINGHAVNAPDGWMFTINDALSNVSASTASVKDGDRVLWFEGTTENQFQGPLWAELDGSTIQWETISTVAELQALAASKDPAVLAKNYKLARDLDLSGVTFSGIGSASAPFTGMFDGQGHTVSHVTVKGGDNAGFFNVTLGAVIKNLHLSDVNVTGGSRVGGLVGWARAELDRQDMAGSKAGLVGSCTVSGTVSGSRAVGGLVGLNEGLSDQETMFSVASAVDKCTAAVSVSGKEKVGGLAGENSGSITKSAAQGSATAPDGVMVGGFAGDNSGGIYDSHAEGEVRGKSYAGGFVGISDGTVKNCYSLGSVAGTDYTGGFAGGISAAENAVGAGLVSVTGTPTYGYTGGFAGRLGGTLAGLDNQITVKNVYGNCMKPDGQWKAAGNSFTGSSEQAAVEGMKLTTWQQVNDKLMELFGVSLPWIVDDTALMDSIAATLTETKDGWSAMDMAAYGQLAGKTARLTDAARQNIMDLLIAEASGTTDAGARSRIELVLRALGVDSTELYPQGSGKAVNNGALLKAMDMSSVTVWAAPYVLLANMQGGVKLTDQQIETLIATIAAAESNGILGSSYGGAYYADPDTTGAAMAALSAYTDRSSAKTLLDKLVRGAANHVAGAGYYSNANSDAMLIIGFIAAGVDPETVLCASGITLVEDMLRYANDANNGFLYAGEDNALATEQGFRALVALAQFRANGGKAYNIYNFSKTAVKPGHATGSGEPDVPVNPPEENEDITVTVSIRTPAGMWMDGKSVTVKKGSTVYHAFIEALRDSGITQSGAASGYVRSMTKGGVTYGEFTHGDNSGWLYKVNGVLPNVALTQKKLADGDDILWYYTTDWKQDPDAGAMAGQSLTAADVIKLIDAIGNVTLDSGSAIAAARTAYNRLPAEEKALVTNYAVLVAAEETYAALVKAQQATSGVKENTAWRTQYETALDKAGENDLTFGSEWLVIALARSGRTVPDSYYDSVVKAVQDAGGELSDKKFSEYSRVILALTAIGKDPADVGGYDLLAKLADMDKVTYQGLNGAIFALIALDSAGYEVPAAAEDANQTSREALVAYILDKQLSDGGWALSGDSADPDMTAMAVQALAAYRDDAAVQAAVDKAVQTLSDMQLSDGGYSSWGTVNSESCAQVIIALTTLGIDPAKDSRFIKYGLSLLDALCAYYKDGGFCHTRDGAADDIATEQALCALTAYARLLNGQTALYDMTDLAAGITPAEPDAQEPAEEQEPAAQNGAVVWIVVAAAAAAAGAAVIAASKRRKKE